MNNSNKNKNFIQQLGPVMSPLRQRSAILEMIPWMQNAYTLLYQPGHKDALFVFKTKSPTYPCVEADTE